MSHFTSAGDCGRTLAPRSSARPPGPSVINTFRTHLHTLPGGVRPNAFGWRCELPRDVSSRRLRSVASLVTTTRGIPVPSTLRPEQPIPPRAERTGRGCYRRLGQCSDRSLLPSGRIASRVGSEPSRGPRAPTGPRRRRRTGRPGDEPCAGAGAVTATTPIETGAPVARMESSWARGRAPRRPSWHRGGLPRHGPER